MFKLQSGFWHIWPLFGYCSRNKGNYKNEPLRWAVDDLWYWTKCKQFTFLLCADGSQHHQSSGAVCRARTAGWWKCLQVLKVRFFFVCLFFVETPRSCVWTIDHFVLTTEHMLLLRCKKMVTASKRFTIHRNPNVLTLALKRFANFTGGKITKVRPAISKLLYSIHISCWTIFFITFFCPQDVKYPEYLDLRPFLSQSQGESQVYALYAVLVHSGFSCHAGHYFCYIKVLMQLHITVLFHQAISVVTTFGRQLTTADKTKFIESNIQKLSLYTA